jgi:hypothetical protein
MPKATDTNTTPTRRSALGFSAAALFAGLTTPALAVADDDPVVALYRRYAAAEAASETANEKLAQLRAILSARWGERGEWKHDPDYREFQRLYGEGDQRVVDLCDLATQMIETPATTLAGVRAKMRVGLSL